jgi:hypothetical protein
MGIIPANFDALLDQHPDYNEIKTLVALPSYVNEPCTVQMSFTLNRTGFVIANYASYTNPVQGRQVRAFTNAKDGMSYIFEVSDMRFYLNGRFGMAENYQGSPSHMQEHIQGRFSILAFGHRHIDLWIGNDIQRPKMYDMDYLWKTNDSLQKRGIFFWEC